MLINDDDYDDDDDDDDDDCGGGKVGETECQWAVICFQNSLDPAHFRALS